MPTIRKIKEHNGDNYCVGQWLICGTVMASQLLATEAWVDAQVGAQTETAPKVEMAAAEPEKKSAAPERNKMLEPAEDK